VLFHGVRCVCSLISLFIFIIFISTMRDITNSLLYFHSEANKIIVLDVLVLVIPLNPYCL